MSLKRNKGLFTAAVVVLSLAPMARASLVGFYNFNGDGTDTSGFGSPLDTTLSGGTGGGAGTAPTYSSDTPTSGGGYPFGGQSLQINSGDSFAYTSPGANTKYELNSFTIETWIKPNVANASGVIYSYVPKGSGGNGRGVLFGISGGTMFLQYSNVANNSFDNITGNATTLPANVWTHIAVSFDWPLNGVNTSFAGYKFFVNGVVDGGSGVGFGTPPFTGGIDYSDGGVADGPNPKSAYISGFHVNNATAPDLAADVVSSLPDGTLLDRFRIHDAVFGSYANGAQGTGLDYFVTPEPASAGLLAIGLMMTAARRKRVAR